MHKSPVVLLGLLLAGVLPACDARGTRRPVDASVGGGTGHDRDGTLPVADAAGGVPIDAGTAPQDASPADDVMVDAGPPHATGTFELPRIPADPALTRRLVPGIANLVGSDRGCCTHAPGGGVAADDRWCAFSRPLPGAAASATTGELWVMNVSKALAGSVPICDGSSADCVRLTAALWTGTAVYGDSHPNAHRFEGDTLIFHAGATPGPHDPYQGPIWAWRPGWKQPRQLTSAHGLLCWAEHESTGVYCLDDALVDVDPVNPFNGPKLHAFDLRAGALTDDDDAPTPLPLVAHIQENGNARLVWRARFSRDGGSFLYSAVPAPGMPETVFAIATAEIGKAAPQPIVADAAQWEIAHDGQKLYFLRGFDHSRGDSATGALMLADLPGGANPTTLQLGILGFELLGSRDEVFSSTDRGALIAYAGVRGRRAWAIMRDRSRPDDLHLLGSNADIAQVATDGRHTLTFQELRGANFPVAFINRSDGSGSCQLTTDYLAETYGGHFSDNARRVFWIEYGRYQSDSEEGWYANPETCGDKVKFGDYIGWYTALGDDFVVFDGGDRADTTRWLQVASLHPAPSGMSNFPRVIQEKPDGIVGILNAAGASVALYTVPGTGADAGLTMHGPFGHPAPGPTPPGN
jgi:hypothetical protein